MTDDDTGVLADTVREETHAIVRAGDAGLADAARATAALRRFSAWNVLLILRARHGIPELVFGWAQWEAMGRFPARPGSGIRLLSPLRGPAARGEDGRVGRVPLPGPESTGSRTMWVRAGWVPVTAFDAPDTLGRPLESMFVGGAVPDRGSAFDALAMMLEMLGVGSRVEPGDPMARLSARPGFGPEAAYDPDLTEPSVLAHLLAHVAVEGRGDERSRACALTVMLCSMLGAPAPDAVPLPERMGVVDVLESCRRMLARLESCASRVPVSTSGRGSSMLALPRPAPSPGRRADGGRARALVGRDAEGGLVFGGQCPVCGRTR